MSRKTAAQLEREIAEFRERKASRPAVRPAGASSRAAGVGLVFKPLGGEGDPWPAWMRGLSGSAGAYVIGDSSGRALYVGSSESSLYDTITRHFQQWKRSKQWWRGMRGEGHDPGMTYERGRCTVAVRTTTADNAKALEAKLIQRLAPRDNLVEHPDGSDPDDGATPF